MQFKGVTGEIRWSYLPALIFGPWRLTTTPTGGSLEAEIVSCDQYRVTQSPLIAAVRMGRQQLTFPVESLQHTGPRVYVTVGPRIREDASGEKASE